MILFFLSNTGSICSGSKVDRFPRVENWNLCLLLRFVASSIVLTIKSPIESTGGASRTWPKLITKYCRATSMADVWAWLLFFFILISLLVMVVFQVYLLILTLLLFFLTSEFYGFLENYPLRVSF